MLSVIGTVLPIACFTLVIYSGYCEITEKDNVIFILLKRIAYKNRLYECGNLKCNKLFRYYQWMLYAEIHNKSCCPHCEKYFDVHPYIQEGRIRKPDKWMNTNSDCPRVNIVELMRINSTISKMSANRKIEEEIQRFEDYNQIKPDLNWISNIQKKSQK